MRRLTILLVLVAAASCGGDGASHDERVSMAEIQVLGTHNSYRQKVPDELFEALAAFDADLAASLDYEHPPITEQLERLGARQLELDVFADPEGGLFATRHINPTFGLPAEAEGLDEPGWKVLHVQEIDYASSCPTFVGCLTEVRDWSLANDGHLPLLVLVEVKDDEIPDPLGVGFVTPVQVDARLLADLDAEIRSVFDDEHLIRPGIEAWPSLADARGKVVFALDNTNDVRDAYRTLDDPAMFTDGDGLFRKLNDPIGDAGAIREAVAAGQVVRTRADADTVQARTGDTAMRDAALASGAQYVSTDYLEPDERFSDYAVRLPGGAVARCNPVATNEACDLDELERR